MRRKPPPGRIGLAAALAAFLHAIVVGALVWASRPFAGVATVPDEPATVEVIEPDDPTRFGDSHPGGGENLAAAPPVQAAPTPPSTEAAEKAPPPAPVASAPAETIRLGDAGDAPGLAPLTTGAQIVPAAPDAKTRNQPPRYPRDAARRGESGTVQLTLHIDPDGSVSAVEVTQSSGFAALDRSAQAALARWRFRPALQDGVPVSSAFSMRVSFEL